MASQMWRRRFVIVEAPVAVSEGRDAAALRMFGGATALRRGAARHFGLGAVEMLHGCLGRPQLNARSA